MPLWFQQQQKAATSASTSTVGRDHPQRSQLDRKSKRCSSSSQTEFLTERSSIISTTEEHGIHTITGTFRKKRPNSKIGIVFRQTQHHIISKGNDEEEDSTTATTTTTYIASIGKTALRKTHLVPGLAVLTINGIPVEGAVHAANIVRRSLADRIVLVAEGQYIETKRRKVLGKASNGGISLSSSSFSKRTRSIKGGSGTDTCTSRDGLVLTQLQDGRVQVKANSSSTNFSLLQGQVLTAINGVTPIDSVDKAYKLLSANRNVRLVVSPPTPSAVATFTSPTITTTATTGPIKKKLAVPPVRAESYRSSGTAFLTEPDSSSSSSGHDLVTICSSSSSSNSSDRVGISRTNSSSQYTTKSSVASEASLMETIDAQMHEDDEEHDDSDDEASQQQLSLCSGSSLLSSTPASVPCHDHFALQEQGQEDDEAYYPRRVIVSVIKKTQTQLCKNNNNTGLSFVQRYRQGIVVRQVADSGIFANTPIQVGDRLLSVNGNRCLDDVLQIHKMLSACKGRVTLEVLQQGEEDKDFSTISSSSSGDLTKLPRKVLLHLQKADPDSKVGLVLRKGAADGARYMYHRDEGLLASIDSLLLPNGSRLEKINGKPCPTSNKDLIDCLKHSFPQLCLECQVPSEGTEYQSPLQRKSSTRSSIASSSSLQKKDGGVVVAKTFKVSSDSKVGISLQQQQKQKNKEQHDNIIIIFAINPNGLLANSKLQVGQRVLRINGIKCPSNVRDACDIIKDTVGTLRIEATSLMMHEEEQRAEAASTTVQDDLTARGDSLESSGNDELFKKSTGSTSSVPPPPPPPPLMEPTTHSTKTFQSVVRPSISKSPIPLTVSVSNRRGGGSASPRSPTSSKRKQAKKRNSTNHKHRNTKKSSSKKNKKRTPVDDAIDLAHKIAARENEFEAEALELETRMSLALKDRTSSFDDDDIYDLDSTKRSHDDELRAIEASELQTRMSLAMIDRVQFPSFDTDDLLSLSSNDDNDDDLDDEEGKDDGDENDDDHIRTFDKELKACDEAIERFSHAFADAKEAAARTDFISGNQLGFGSLNPMQHGAGGPDVSSVFSPISTPVSKRKKLTSGKTTTSSSDLDAYAELVGGFDSELMEAYKELKEAELDESTRIKNERKSRPKSLIDQRSCLFEANDAVTHAICFTEAKDAISYSEVDDATSFTDLNSTMSLYTERSQAISVAETTTTEGITDQNVSCNGTQDYSILSTDTLLEKALLLARAIADDDEETVEFSEREADESIRAIPGDASFASHMKTEECMHSKSDDTLFLTCISPIRVPKQYPKIVQRLY